MQESRSHGAGWTIYSRLLCCGHCKGLELMSLLARVRNSESLFQSNVLYFVFTWDLAAVRFTGVSVIAGCPQGES